ncbi:class II fumarate hydratase [Aneurinibacillus terranovensis]|uniref:class II fumarate hydratase n=1 Tax=Aneurinibacillus terranovensis TaxID=278991 RepID=UPI00041DD6AC|nr:aspartate ammonia-lyase [Aneurinibacillus terranovensis]
MTDYRITHDTLGEVKVPKDAYYGAQTQRAVENFPISGLHLPPAFIRAQGIIKWAAAKANMELGQLSEEVGQAIMQAADEVIEGKLNGEFVVDAFQAGAGTSQNMNANEVIATRAVEILGKEKGDYSLVHPNDHVNMAQSTNDTIHVAINIAAAELLDELLMPNFEQLCQTFEKKAEEFHGIIKSGRTHLQDAVPMRLGQEFGGYAATLREKYNHLLRTRESLLEIGLGGNAVGTGINAHPEYAQRAIRYIAERTGREFKPATHRFMFMQNTQAAIRVSEALKEVAIHLIKITSDLRLLSSGPRTGLAEIVLPAVQPGSSIMPGKVNPVMLEMMYMICAQVIGNSETITIAGLGSQLEINVMMPVIAHNLLQSIQILANGMRTMDERNIRGITADEGRCRELMERSLALATSLNPLIGYEKAAAIAKEAHRTNKSIAEVAREQGGISEQELADALNPERLV